MTDEEILLEGHRDDLIKAQRRSAGGYTGDAVYWTVDDVIYLDLDKANEAVKKHNDKILDINSEANKEIIANARETTRLSGIYYDDLLSVWTDTEEARVDATMSANDAIMVEMEDFASNREEMFWGSRENFTGALYKTIQQGQVENLMYKTEIMQTNNFYGVTLDEAIDRVQVGVLDILRGEGVIE